MRICAFCAAFVLCAVPAFSQRGGAAPPAPSRGGSGNPAGPATGSRPTTGFPNQPNSPTNQIPGTNEIPNTNGPNLHDYFITGKVMLDDGSPPSPDIRIERVCNGQPHLETYTDSKGRFSIQLGAPNGVIDTDAADGASMQIPGQSGSSFGGAGGIRDGANPYWNCELRAALPGYRSDSVTLATLQPFETRLGTIVLHRIGGVKASTISVTSALAPKRAQKDYRKALDLVSKRKYDQAEKRLLAATAVYPKYASAWYELGRLQAREKRLDAARQSFQSAIAADSHYMSPYNELAGVAAEQRRWQEAVKYSNDVIAANPDAFPSSYWYNALGNYELKQAAAAEKSASELVKIDTLHEYPQAQRMLAALLLNRADYADAALHLRSYLNLDPHGKDSAQLRQALAKIEQAAGHQTSAQASAGAKAQKSAQAKQ
ncbi:MAG: tetratricopeptide repeat protein [Bryobacteraceae bacterium]